MRNELEPPAKPKVFCIGFHKTGTSSMAVALRRLGYRVTGPIGVHHRSVALARWRALRAVSRFDAFQDNPYPLLYLDLDRRWPDSRFILTVRDSDSWLRSVVIHFGSDETPMRRWIYGVGSPLGNENTYVERYLRHNEEVRRYFAERPDDLLVMNVADGDGWQELCRFLDEPTPTEPFPHANRRVRAQEPTDDHELD